MVISDTKEQYPYQLFMSKEESDFWLSVFHKTKSLSLTKRGETDGGKPGPIARELPTPKLSPPCR